MALEDELFNKIKNGDDSGLDELIRLYYPEILSYCAMHTRDMPQAEDAAQETFLKAVSHLDSYCHRGKFRAYLYRIAQNVCTNLWRRKVAEPLSENISYYEDIRFRGIESDIDLERLLAPLSHDLREIIILRFVQELKIREIGEVLNLPMRTVQSRLRSGLKLIRKNLLKGDASYGQEI